MCHLPVWVRFLEEQQLVTDKTRGQSCQRSFLSFQCTLLPRLQSSVSYPSSLLTTLWPSGNLNVRIFAFVSMQSLCCMENYDSLHYSGTASSIYIRMYVNASWICSFANQDVLPPQPQPTTWSGIQVSTNFPSSNCRGRRRSLPIGRNHLPVLHGESLSSSAVIHIYREGIAVGVEKPISFYLFQ